MNSRKLFVIEVYFNQSINQPTNQPTNQVNPRKIAVDTVSSDLGKHNDSSGDDDLHDTLTYFEVFHCVGQPGHKLFRSGRVHTCR